MLHEFDKKRLTDFYSEALRRHGPQSAESLHWQSAYNQLRRFEILLQVGDVDGKSVLDVGCGLGDLYEYAREQGKRIEYAGIDIVPEFIEAARERFPAAAFELRDAEELPGEFDYVLASGAMSFKVYDHENFYFGMIRGLYEHARIAVAFNMLDATTLDGNDTYAVYDPKKVADFCGTFCDKVQIAVGYMPDDFTVYLYK